MYKAGDPELVRKEKEELRMLESKGGWAKIKYYFSNTIK